MTEAEKNAQTFREFVQRCSIDGDLDAVDQYFHPEFRDHAFPKAVGGPEGERQTMEVYQRSFPDMIYDIETIVAEGDKLACLASFRGTHSGEYLGVAATNRTFEAKAIELMRFQDGKIIERWAVFEFAKMLEQLGISENDLSM